MGSMQEAFQEDFYRFRIDITRTQMRISIRAFIRAGGRASTELPGLLHGFL